MPEGYGEAMTDNAVTRRTLSIGGGLAAALYGVPGAGLAATSREHADGEDVSHLNAAIHQEVDFVALPSRLYEALTVSERFDRVVQLSAAMQSGVKKPLGSAPTMIDARPGGAFALFGGYVSGRFLDLDADKRIVQAWRSASWDAGFYSIATFLLVRHGEGTRLVFDHRGFPNDAAAELSKGWRVNYWEPLAKALI